MQGPPREPVAPAAAEPEPLPPPRSFIEEMQAREFAVHLEREAEQGRAQRAADYAPLDAMAARVASTRMSGDLRDTLSEGLAQLRDEVSEGREAGDRRQVERAHQHLAEFDEVLADLAAGRLPELEE